MELGTEIQILNHRIKVLEDKLFLMEKFMETLGRRLGSEAVWREDESTAASQRTAAKGDVATTASRPVPVT